ncbi:MAG: septum formation initiator family protein [Anaerolineales bacterium]|nr:septum formation initiator family protein [Anaerolineales bacterium]
MKEKSKIIRISAIGIALILMIYFVMTFNRLTAKYQRLITQAEEVGLQVTALSATNQYLETQVVLATSDDAVRKWAYEEAHMIQEGDIPIVPIAPEHGTPTPQVDRTEVSPQEVRPWQVWWALFFGDHLP